MGIPIESGRTNSKVFFHTATGIPVTRNMCSMHGCSLEKQMLYSVKKPSMTLKFFKGLKSLFTKVLK